VIAKLRSQLPDAWQYFLAPLLAALLPWKLGYRWLRRLSRGRSAFDEPARAALAVAPQHLAIADTAEFAANVRLNCLLDITDLYLSLLRRRRSRLPWHVQQVGEWPRDTHFIAAGSHHGNGHWVFKSLALAGFDSTFVSGRWERAAYPGLPLRYHYGRLRGGDIQRLGGRAVIFRPNARAQLAQVLAQGAVPVSLFDVPPRLAPNGQQPVQLLGQPVCMPAGALQLAREAGVPVVPYWMEFDLASGRRRLVIGQPLDPADPATLQQIADVLDRALRLAPAAWFFWPEWPRWVADAAAAVQAGDSGGED
jgi:phosphatidylinositol dimannoside acyltransferase